jgi:N-acetylglucosaminyl-diphospho-decaprenol L-rhamnosyltransferase
MPERRRVAIAIVSYRNPHEVADCLVQLARSSHEDFSVYVCENGGSEAYRGLCDMVPSRLPGGQAVTLLNAGENLGYAGGVNCALEAAGKQFDAAWILNPDTLPEPGALAALLRRLDRGDVDAVGGVLLQLNGEIQGFGGRWRSKLAIGGSIGLFRPPDQPIDEAEVEAEQSYLMGASMLVSRRFIEVNGPMRADYFLYVEEVEWCLRAQRNGLRLGFTAEAIVRHHQGTTTGWAGSFRQRPKMPIYLDARNRVRLTRQMNPTWLWTAVPAILLHAIWRYARRGAWRQVAYVFEGVAAGLRGESGRPSWAGR